ncbi:hypothetical protein [Planctomycetes bacterium K23_9]|uniref:Secreted protein n=1 Tax=Stieleria marina TaxID=1930275 RepID=A0A517NRD3_9BACT|nr:hypothetical protein K239x_16130 [Planctomycetes bacterium K23_9]
MKITHLFLLACCFTLTVAGCSGNEENTVITDDLTADDFAKYEADLAKANGEGNYDEESEE